MSAPTISDSIYQTFISSATLPAYTRVKVDTAGELAAAGATDEAIGFLTERGAVENEAATVRMATAPSQIARANAAMEIGDIVFAAAAGRVDDADAGTAVVIGYCMTTVTTQDQLVVVITKGA